jgi:hypothetical protein
MANGSQDNTPQPDAQGGADAGAGDKLYAGKFKSVEDLERSYQEAEKEIHSRPSRQEFNDLRDLIESRLPDPQASAYGQGGQYVPQQPAADESNGKAMQELQEFYRDPSSYRRKIEEGTIQRWRNEQQAQQQAVAVFEQWRGENPDIAEEVALTSFYLQQEPVNLAPRKKLENVGPKVREHIARIKRAGQQSPTPQPNDHVEGPGRQSRPAVQQQSEPKQEDTLAPYLAERKAAMKPRKPR